MVPIKYEAHTHANHIFYVYIIWIMWLCRCAASAGSDRKNCIDKWPQKGLWAHTNGIITETARKYLVANCIFRVAAVCRAHQLVVAGRWQRWQYKCQNTKWPFIDDDLMGATKYFFSHFQLSAFFSRFKNPVRSHKIENIFIFITERLH